MKKYYSYFCLLTLFSTNAYSQFVAGELTNGHVITPIDYTLEDGISGGAEEVLFDLNCDGEDDIVLSLNKGNLASDWPNSFTISTVDASTQVLVDTISDGYAIRHLKLYNENDSINRPEDSTFWSSYTNLGIAAIGGFCPPQSCYYNADVSNKYFAVKKILGVGNEVLIWVKLSINISGNNTGIGKNDTIIAIIHEISTSCEVDTSTVPSDSSTVSSVEENNSETINVYYSKGLIIINSFNEADNPVNIAVCNISGQVIYSNSLRLSAGRNTIELPTSITTGLYLLSVQGDEFYFTHKMVVE